MGPYDNIAVFDFFLLKITLKSPLQWAKVQGKQHFRVINAVTFVHITQATYNMHYWQLETNGLTTFYKRT